MNAVLELQEKCFRASYDAGWWHHADTGLPYIPGDAAITEDGIVRWSDINEPIRLMIIHYWPMMVACKIALIHSEVSEAMGAHRIDGMDDKLKHRLGIETEMADSMIRQFDLAGAMTYAAQIGIIDPKTHRFDLDAAISEKMGFNANRSDHKISNRRKPGGKIY